MRRQAVPPTFVWMTGCKTQSDAVESLPHPAADLDQPRLAIINGVAGAAWAPHGRVRAVLNFTVVDGKVTAIDLVADRESLDQLDVELPPREGE